MARWRQARTPRRGTPSLPLPPLHYRTWVGPTDEARYDNPTGALVYGDFPAERYESVLDFGCGCGRVARQLIQQVPRPRRYVGIDVHPELIDWCREHLRPAAPGFEFHHHDVRDALVNAGADKPDVLPFPVADASVTLLEALSIFTHIVERQLPFYLREAARVVREDGEINASFLLFEKDAFPVLDDARNALYIDDAYPPAAVYYDRGWLERTIADAGLAVTRIAQRPETRGYQWRLVLAPLSAGVTAVPIPRDEGPLGVPADFARVRGGLAASGGQPCESAGIVDDAPIHIEEATTATDTLVEAVASLVGELSASARPPSAEELARIVASPASRLLLAREADRIVGMLTLVVFPIPTGMRAWIEDVVVVQAARGRGIGASLTSAALALAGELGARTVDLTSRPSREAANRMYVRLGFTQRETNVYRYEGSAA